MDQSNIEVLPDYEPVTAVEALPDYRLKLTFASEEVCIFDFKPYLKWKIFYDLNDVKLFETAQASFHTVVWANDADIAPETLYWGSIPIEEYEAKTGQTL